jgi:hypothetical protein
MPHSVIQRGLPAVEFVAAIHRLIGTAGLNGFGPERYLQDVLSHIGDHFIYHTHELFRRNPATEPNVNSRAA